MIRHFDLRDAMLVQKLSNRGISFDSRACFTDDLHLLRNAVFANLLPSLLPETQMIDLDGKPFGFAQLSHRRGHPISRLRFFSPREIALSEPGSGLVEALLTEAGRCMTQHLLAEAEENTEEFGFLRREGFSVYARQGIWKGTIAPTHPASLPKGMLRLLTDSDCPAIHTLYSSVVPALVQQVEGLPRPLSGWGLFEKGVLVGVFLVQAGPRGFWMQPFLHPEARNVAEWTAALIHAFDIHPNRPLHICLRSYQDGLGMILRDHGFSLFADQAVMARRVVAAIPALQTVPLASVEKSLPHVTTIRSPVSQEIYDTATSNHR